MELQYIQLENHDPKLRSFDLLMISNGKIMHWNTYSLKGTDEVDGIDQKTIQGKWPEKLESFTLYVRIDRNTNWTEFSTEKKKIDAACFGLIPTLNPDDELIIDRGTCKQ
ncbi:hypothetical protein BG842_00710 [Haladaptatus sp. W1]|nr:hypothetical protein BG842_00710 [Haladaptatus sp. W1]